MMNRCFLTPGLLRENPEELVHKVRNTASIRRLVLDPSYHHIPISKSSCNSIADVLHENSVNLAKLIDGKAGIILRNHSLDLASGRSEVEGLLRLPLAGHTQYRTGLEDQRRFSQRQEVALNRIAAVDTLAQQLLLDFQKDFGAEGSEFIDLIGGFIEIGQEFPRRLIEGPVLRPNEVHRGAP